MSAPQVFPFFFATVALLSCAGTAPKRNKPLGLLPSAVTTAEPNWIPFTIRAGAAVEVSAAEGRHFVALRQVTVDGTSHTPSWSADSRHLVFTSRSASNCGEVRRLDLEHGTSHTVTAGAGSSSSGVFDAQGDVLLAHAASDAPPCGEQPAKSAESATATRLPAPLGILLRNLDDSDIVVIDDGKVQPLISRVGYDGDLAIGPGRLLFTSIDNGDYELFVAGRDGSDPKPITKSIGYDGRGRYSADGASLVWQAEPAIDDSAIDANARSGGVLPRHAPHELVVVIAGSLGQRRRVLFAGGRYNITPSFMSDSRHVVFSSDYDAADDNAASPSFELYKIAPGDEQPERITYSPGFDAEPTVSPDGRYLAFTSSRGSSDPAGSNVFIARLR